MICALSVWPSRFWLQWNAFGICRLEKMTCAWCDTWPCAQPWFGRIAELFSLETFGKKPFQSFSSWIPRHMGCRQRSSKVHRLRLPMLCLFLYAVPPSHQAYFNCDSYFCFYGSYFFLLLLLFIKGIRMTFHSTELES